MEEPTAQYKIGTIVMPKYAWRCTMSQNYSIYYEAGHQPNAFRRLMQRILLGFKWERIA